MAIDSIGVHLPRLTVLRCFQLHTVPKASSSESAARRQLLVCTPHWKTILKRDWTFATYAQILMFLSGPFTSSSEGDRLENVFLWKRAHDGQQLRPISGGDARSELSAPPSGWPPPGAAPVVRAMSIGPGRRIDVFRRTPLPENNCDSYHQGQAVAPALPLLLIEFYWGY